MAEVTRLFWDRVYDGGAEVCQVVVDERGLRAAGTSVGGAPAPFRCDYSVQTGPDFVTTSLDVEIDGSRRMRLRRDEDGTWYVGQRAEQTLSEALDCDLGLCPLTNTLPILRGGLLTAPAETVLEITAAWVLVPELTAQPARQVYTVLDPGLIRYESDGFRADLVVDADGFVVDYPALARRRS